MRAFVALAPERRPQSRLRAHSHPGHPGRGSARIGAARASMRWRGVGRIAIRRSGGARSCFRVKPSFMIAWQWTYTRTRGKLERVAMLVESDTRSASPEPIDEVPVHARCGRRFRRRMQSPAPLPGLHAAASSPPIHALTHQTAEPGLPRPAGSRDGHWAPWPRQCPATTRRASGSGRSPPSAGPLSTPPARAAHARSAISVSSSLARSLARSG